MNRTRVEIGRPLTVAQAAEIAGVGAAMVYGWVKSKALTHERHGGAGRGRKIVIREDKLAAFLASRQVGGHSVLAPEGKASAPADADFPGFYEEVMAQVARKQRRR
jgi:hypothetical protein